MDAYWPRLIKLVSMLGKPTEITKLLTFVGHTMPICLNITWMTTYYKKFNINLGDNSQSSVSVVSLLLITVSLKIM